MSVKGKKFADDGWALWVDGDDVSTVYFHDWMNPTGQSFVDVSIKIEGIKRTSAIHLYVPFRIEGDEIEDISHRLKDEEIARATFSSGCIVEYLKNEYTSEIAYSGKTVDIIHLAKTEVQVQALANGTQIDIDYVAIQPYIDNEVGYFSLRLPHKSLDHVFHSHQSTDSFLEKVHDVLTTPVVTEKYGYSIRVNETRSLPSEINKKGAFHRQKLKKTMVTISVNEAYEINDAGCIQIRRLEEALYREYVPQGFLCEDVITYQWQEGESGSRGKFNLYLSIARSSVSSASMIVYMILLLLVGAAGDFCADFILWLVSLF